MTEPTASPGQSRRNWMIGGGIALALAVIIGIVLVAGGDDDEETTSTTIAAVTIPALETTPADTTPADTTPAATTPAATQPPATDPAPAFEGELVGTFSIAAGVCDAGAVTAGSYFQMVQPGGTPAAGPFIPNGDSSCVDKNFSALTPGTDGGLATGTHQPAPDPAYDANGNGLAGAMFAPVTFFAVAFAGATDPAEATPTIVATDGTLTGDLSAFTAYYGGGDFNQGAPKPDGSGSAPTGTIDPVTGAYVLEWTSLISGGGFDGFTGVWHLEGTFTPAG